MKRFSAELESKLLKKMAKMFTEIEAEEQMSEQAILELEEVFELDPASVYGIFAKTEEAKRFMVRYKNKHSTAKEPQLDFKEKKEAPICKYSIEYLEKFIAFFKCFDKFDPIQISIAYEYPMQMENEHFRITLAPRVDS